MNLLTTLLPNNQAVKTLATGQGKIVTSYIQDEAFLMAGAFALSKKVYFVVKSNLYEAQQYYAILKQLLGDDCCYYPCDESVRLEILAQSPEMLAERLNTYERLLSGQPTVVVTHPAAILRHSPNKETYLKFCLSLTVGQQFEMKDLQRRLVEMGYQYILNVDQPFYFSHRGGIIDVFSNNYEQPLRIEFFDDEIDSIRFFDQSTQRTIQTVNEVRIIPATEILFEKEEINDVIAQINAAYEKKAKQLESDLRDDLRHYLNVDIENLRSHDTTPSMNKYYAYFKRDSSIINFIDDGCVVLSPYSSIKENERLLFEELYGYQQEMFQEGRMLSGLDVLYEVEEILSKRKQIVEMETFKTQPGQIIFNARSIDGVKASTEDDLLKYLRSFSSSTKLLIVLDNEHLLHKISQLCLNHQLKVYDFKKEGFLHQGINLLNETLSFGIEFADEKIVLLTAKELFGLGVSKKHTFVKYKNAKILKNFEDLQIGDYIVHDIHGVGQYMGIKTLEAKGVHKDYLYIAYRGNDVLYIPVDQFKMIRKYTSSEGRVPKVNKLGSTEWAKTKQRIKKKTDDIAEQLIELYAKRMAQPGFAFPEDGEDQKMFEEDFGYELTTDQDIAVMEIKNDMQLARPMDRLLCGDVGFGKTEVALRAAFKAIEAGKQVALLCPTTILSSQHYRTACERFKQFPVEIALLNRYVSAKQQKEILSKVSEGKVDLLIGTHRILSKDVKFKDVGLLIVDEEQRFGVKHKEKIKEYKETVDVLTLTATPIPRTLQMSLMGIRGLSTINTPPKNRYPVQTYVVEKSKGLIKQAIERELARGGQVFYLYNKTEDINRVARELEENIPGVKVAVGHGQMDKTALENVMNHFIKKEFNVLVCTTIVETGIDIPNANTMIVEDADHFGLSQLYQIKGRVGRSNRHAYAYLMYRPNKQLSEEATKRLKAIKEFTELGSGYKIAMRDLNIRGAGDILGGEQAGFIDTVGFDMFMRILQESIDEKQGKVQEEEKEIETRQISTDAYIPENYVNSDLEKLRLYQQLHEAKSLHALEETQKEFTDRYGRLPREMENLVDKRAFDILTSQEDIETVVESSEGVEMTFTKEATNHIDGEALMILCTDLSKKIRISFRFNKVAVKFPKLDNQLKLMNRFLKETKMFIK